MSLELSESCQSIVRELSDSSGIRESSESHQCHQRVIRVSSESHQSSESSESSKGCWEGHPRNRCKETVNLSYCFISRPTKIMRSITLSHQSHLRIISHQRVIKGIDAKRQLTYHAFLFQGQN